MKTITKVRKSGKEAGRMALGFRRGTARKPTTGVRTMEASKPRVAGEKTNSVMAPEEVVIPISTVAGARVVPVESVPEAVVAEVVPVEVQRTPKAVAPVVDARPERGPWDENTSLDFTSGRQSRRRC